MPNSTGLLLPPSTDPGDIVAFARAAEAAGFGTLWVVEDCFLSGGIAQAGVILALTSRITVGIGILPAAVRNPAFAAMEIATLAGMFPGRLVAGIGHGMPGWMRQVGAWPASPLGLLRETLQAVRSLLSGETVSGGVRALGCQRRRAAAPRSLRDIARCAVGGRHRTDPGGPGPDDRRQIAEPARPAGQALTCWSGPCTR